MSSSFRKICLQSNVHVIRLHIYRNEHCGVITKSYHINIINLEFGTVMHTVALWPPCNSIIVSHHDNDLSNIWLSQIIRHFFKRERERDAKKSMLLFFRQIKWLQLLLRNKVVALFCNLFTINLQNQNYKFEILCIMSKILLRGGKANWSKVAPKRNSIGNNWSMF